MKLKVNPTRMELLKLRKRLRLAERGHKLLKDKEEQLLIEFRTLVEEVKEQRKSTEKQLAQFYYSVLKLKGMTTSSEWEKLVNNRSFKTDFYVEEKRIFNIPISEITFTANPESSPPDYMASPYFEKLIEEAKKMMAVLNKLCFTENKLISFASEIERTRRRVNALEYVLIPNIKETLRFINFKLNENERTALVTLKHIQLTRQ